MYGSDMFPTISWKEYSSQKKFYYINNLWQDNNNLWKDSQENSKQSSAEWLKLQRNKGKLHGILIFWLNSYWNLNSYQSLLILISDQKHSSLLTTRNVWHSRAYLDLWTLEHNLHACNIKIYYPKMPIITYSTILQIYMVKSHTIS